MTGIKKTILLYLITGVVFFFGFNKGLFANINNDVSTDPFIKVWKYFDGINTYSLTITTSHAPGQDYYIHYTFPGGSASTDMCRISSNRSFTCMSGETIIRNDAEYSIRLTSGSATYVFYDPNHMPDSSKLLGHWSMDSRGAHYTISIMRGPSDNDYNVTTSFHDDRGNYCDIGFADVYHAMINSDNSQTLSYHRFSFKYDPLKNQILNPNPGKDFYAGQCVEMLDDGAIVFTKD